ncbi:cellular apoptosis susceptibility protein, putative / importin-alpha re-exporter [Actinidia rufa]|uniref:Cellular apoptosis susceptibility protein, putative / importin-alpha re-exporter n=1 Tax=Actinidia rufa TaxID=165716 RepID=A0A7J0FBY6_9ERIC|nr:cellular apoptosis susceptibility protein, putative / importin-alpha re-exporter [Actinidia rufa]
MHTKVLSGHPKKLKRYSFSLNASSTLSLLTRSPPPPAEASLAEAADRPNYALAVLRLVAEPAVDEPIRQAAAVNFKNHLRSRWSSSEPNAEALTPVPDSEKEQIKALIVRLMLSSAPRIQSQLSEALAVIGKHDFPKLWPALLPELKSSLEKAGEASDYAPVNGILGTAGLIDNVVISGGQNVVLRSLIESQRLCCRIFYSLNFQELPEFFEDHMGEWMGEFQKYLSVKYPALEDGGGDGLEVVDELRAAVCENISLYMEKNEEEFQGYLGGFAEAVWNLLVAVSASSSRDRLTVTAIKFLTTVSTSVHHTLFARDDILQQICQSIVIPNVMLRDEDEELFEMNYVEFIRRDMEGSDLDTRRRIACELLKGIATNYKRKGIRFRNPFAMALIPDVVRFLGSDSNVVHSYAASCIEKLFALGKSESEENPYIMKCIMRVLGVADISCEVALPCITGLTSVLNKVCENPRNPVFNHYLFEAVAILIRRSCEKDPSLISAFEAGLFPSLELILTRDVTEFFPYAFQLLAQLVELHRPPIPQRYMQIFEILLLPDSWKKSGNVPALVRLLQAFLQKAPHELNQEGRLTQTITGSIELKLTSVASTRLICESQALLDPAASRHWGKMLDSIVTLLSRPEQDRVEEEPDVPDFADNVGYGATFVHLYNAGKKEEDPLRDIRDPKQFLVASLASFFCSFAWEVPPSY